MPRQLSLDPLSARAERCVTERGARTGLAAEVRWVVKSNVEQDREGVEQNMLGLGKDPQQVEGQVQGDKQDQGEVHKLETGGPHVGKWGQ